MDGRRRPLCASYSNHRGYIGERPFVYPIFYPFTSGRAEQLCASGPSNSHTFESPKVSERLSPMDISRLEPRVSLPGDAPVQVLVPAVQGVGWYTQGGTGWVYTQGCTSPIPGWCICRYLSHTRVVYVQGIPPMLPGWCMYGVSLPCYPGGVCTGVYAHHATRVVYVQGYMPPCYPGGVWAGCTMPSMLPTSRSSLTKMRREPSFLPF